MNFYLRLFGAVFILISVTGFGFYLSYRLKLRRDFFKSFIDFLTTLDTNIRYSGDDILYLIKISAPSFIDDFFNGEEDDFKIFWENSVSKIPKSYGLTRDDYNLLYEFARLLGTTDVEGQLNHIELYKCLFSTALDNSEKEYKTKSKLYRLLGFFCGAMLAIMII